MSKKKELNKKKTVISYGNPSSADEEVSLAAKIMRLLLRMSKTSGLGSRISCMCQLIVVCREKQMLMEQYALKIRWEWHL